MSTSTWLSGVALALSLTGCAVEIGDVDTACDFTQLGRCLEQSGGDSTPCAEMIDACRLPEDGSRHVFVNQQQVLEKLRDQAAACYAAQNALCLKGVYSTLALGGLLQGYPTASRNLLNFLYVGLDPLDIDSQVVQRDANVQGHVDEERGLAIQTALGAIKNGAASFTHFAAPRLVTATDKDLYYALGSFTLQARAKGFRRADDPTRADVTMTFELTDRYDWHPGLMAGGPAHGVFSFEDEWAHFLVQNGMAHEFDMASSWEVKFVVQAAPPPPKKATWEPCATDHECQSAWCGCNDGSAKVCLPGTGYPKDCQPAAGCKYTTPDNTCGPQIPKWTWRCVYSPSADANVSQVCISGYWVNYHFHPSNCAACCGDYSSDCY